MGLRKSCVLAMMIFLFACGEEAGTSPTSPATASRPSSDIVTTSLSADSPRTTTTIVSSMTNPPTPETGISEEEAEKTGVLTGTYDALLTGPDSGEENDQGCLELEFTLSNVGKSEDSYRVSASDPDVKAEPAEFSLKADEVQDLVVTACDSSIEELVIDVWSEGLNDIVAQATF